MGTSVSTCRGCGAEIIFANGQDTVKCEYCGLVSVRPSADKDKTPHSEKIVNPDAENLIRQAYTLLEKGDFSQAAGKLENGLRLDPENASAYIGQLMIELNATKEKDIAKSCFPLTIYQNYANALRFASLEEKARLERYNQEASERHNQQKNTNKQRIRKAITTSCVLTAIIIAAVLIVYNAVLNSLEDYYTQQALAQKEEPTSRDFGDFTAEKASTSSPETSPNTVIRGGNFTFKSDEVYAALSPDNDFVKFEKRNIFDYPEYTADWSSAGSLRIIVFTEPGNRNVKAITLVCDGSSVNSSHGDAFVKYFMQMIGLCNVPKDFSEISAELGLSNFTIGPNPVTMHSNGVGIDFTWNNEDAFFKIYPKSTTLDIGSLPIKIDRPPDFFTDDARRQAYKELIDTFQFSEILALANEYIAQSSPTELDSVYTVIEKAQTGADNLENCTVVKDEFEGDVSIYYNGVEKLSSKINILPYIDGQDDAILVGFTAPDWLFFNTVYIKADDKIIENAHYMDSAITQDVTDNGINEYVRIILSEDDINKIINSENAAIRFENDESGKTRDHTITESEKNALRAISTIRLSYVNLSNLCFHWEKD